MRLIDADALRFLPEWKQGVVYQEHINSAPTISTIRAVPIIGAEWETEILDGIPGRRANIHFCSRCGFCPTYTTPYDVDGANFVENIPAADVRENVVGEWIQHYETTSDNETLPYGWECSLCGRWEMEKQPFCNCGAQMGGAEDGE